MYKYFWVLVGCLFTTFACQSSGNDLNGGASTSAEEASLEQSPPITVNVEMDGTSYFSIEVPRRMQRMKELNDEAVLQLGYAEDKTLGDGSFAVYEHYVVALIESKAEIEAYSVPLQPDLLGYHTRVLETLMGEDSKLFECITPEPIIETTAGISAIYTELQQTSDIGRMSSQVYYWLGVYEGENGFYQVLTWCNADQKSIFKADMEAILHSLKEI